MDKNADPTNPLLVDTIERLEDEDAPVWSDVAENLGKVNRKRAEVNLSEIERNTEEGDTVVVPGKVLGSGRLSKDVTVAAFKASRGARNHIEEMGEFKFIQDLVDENPEGSEVKIVK